MNSFLLTGDTLETRSNYLHDLINPAIELIHIFAEKTSISIKQIQDLTTPLSIAPRLPRLVWIEEANLMTIPAQNALLKMLEEPPEFTSFYLTCASSSTLLPTISSRTKLINLKNKNEPIDPQILSDLKLVMAMTAGDRLIAIVKRDRTESLAWITQIETALRYKLQEKNLSRPAVNTLAKIAKLTEQTHLQLLANCSVSLATQHFYLTLPHTHSSK